MSFDLRISNKDLLIGSDGDLAIVEDSEKLIQDILKIALTKLGGNPFFPWYGSPLSSSSIGNVLDYQMMASINGDQLRQTLQRYQQMQVEQIQSGQTVTAAESLAAINSVVIQRSTQDPRIYLVSISVFTKALTTVSTDFTIAL